MDILVISAYHQPAEVYGGPVPALCNLNKALARSGQNVTVYTTNANGAGDLAVPCGQPVMVDGLPVTFFPRWWFGRAQKPRNLFFSPAMGRQLRRLQPGDFDLILIHAAFCDPGRLAAWAARRTKIPYICYTYGSFEPWAFKHKYFKKKIYFYLNEKWILKEAAGIIVSNDAEIENLRRLNINAPIKRIPCESLAAVSDIQNSPSKKLAALFPALADRPFMLFLSRLHPKKGLDMLIPAFASLTQEFPDWLLVLAGPDEGGYRAHLRPFRRFPGAVLQRPY